MNSILCAGCGANRKFTDFFDEYWLSVPNDRRCELKPLDTLNVDPCSECGSRNFGVSPSVLGINVRDLGLAPLKLELGAIAGRLIECALKGE